jgi:hypothetical protein
VQRGGRNTGTTKLATVMHNSRCARVNQSIYRQTSSLNTARGSERRAKCCAKLAQKSRERPAGKSGLRKRLIFGVLQGVSGFFNHDTILLRRGVQKFAGCSLLPDFGRHA